LIAGSDLAKSYQEEVIGQLVGLQRRAMSYARRDFFYAEQNVRLVKNAEAYYRSMFLQGHWFRSIPNAWDREDFCQG
jgi:erythromycin esterase-like protein